MLKEANQGVGGGAFVKVIEKPSVTQQKYPATAQQKAANRATNTESA